jgi:hypothetical protein
MLRADISEPSLKKEAVRETDLKSLREENEFLKIAE